MDETLERSLETSLCFKIEPTYSVQPSIRNSNVYSLFDPDQIMNETETTSLYIFDIIFDVRYRPISKNSEI